MSGIKHGWTYNSTVIQNHYSIGIHNSLQTVCHHQNSHVAPKFMPERSLDDGVGFVICISRSYRRNLCTRGENIPIADVASSRIRSLLCRTMALANAIIWRCPTDRLFPPEAMLLSKVRRLLSLSGLREKRPEARRELYKVESSCSSKGSRFRLKVPG